MKHHHSVLIANSRGPETLKQLAQETGAVPVPVADAATGVDLLVIAIPVKSVHLLPADLLILDGWRVRIRDSFGDLLVHDNNMSTSSGRR